MKFFASSSERFQYVDYQKNWGQLTVNLTRVRSTDGFVVFRKSVKK